MLSLTFAVLHIRPHSHRHTSLHGSKAPVHTHSHESVRLGEVEGWQLYTMVWKPNTGKSSDFAREVFSGLGPQRWSASKKEKSSSKSGNTGNCASLRTWLSMQFMQGTQPRLMVTTPSLSSEDLGVGLGSVSHASWVTLGKLPESRYCGFLICNTWWQ